MVKGNFDNNLIYNQPEMKRIALLVLVFFVHINLFAVEVPQRVAKEHADGFMYKKLDKSITESSIFPFQKGENRTYTYLVSYKPEGWAIVAADDRIPAIIAYSLKGSFDTVKIKEVPFYFWFQHYANQIKEVVEGKETKRHASWDNHPFEAQKSTSPVEPLIGVEWNQGSGWNAYCPADSEGPGGHAYAGCVAVAMGQALSVYQHPEVGYGQNYYVDDTYGSLGAVFGDTQYKWDSIMGLDQPNKYVALLLYHLGVSVDMNYGADGSGAFSSMVPGALKTFFDYTNSTTILKRSNFTSAQWDSILVSELANGRPIYYSGDPGDGTAGHAFNIDGVDDQNRYHLNWGWSGAYNGYYLITSLTPGSNNFSSNQEAVVNIMPRNHNPQDILLSNNSIKEGLPAYSLVGKVNVLDETPGDSHTLEVIAPPTIDGEPGFVPFAILGDSLLTTEILNFQTRNRYEIIIKATDKAGHSLEKSFFINVIKNTGVSDLTLSGEMIITPTNDGNLKVWLNNSAIGRATMNLYDINGKLIFSTTISKELQVLDTTIPLGNTLIKGLYIAVLNFGNEKISYKFVK